MADADSIEEQALEDLESGVQSFSDGTNSATVIDPEKRLKIAEHLRRRDAASTQINSIFGNTVRIVSPGSWE